MKVNMKQYLSKFAKENIRNLDTSYFSDVVLETENIKAIMINEIAANNPNDDFYSHSSNPAYLKTTIPLFKEAGIEVNKIEDILNLGIYITNAVKFPKTETMVESSTIKSYMPVLEKEIELFPNLKVIMLMGDVAKKSFNMITKKKTKKNAIPPVSTYKIRSSEIYYDETRLLPSYIMTGKNILIEKSKFQMAAEDIKKMWEIIK
ncbi:uracil-DNA glycosylase family protein [Clostridium sp. JS66]|uniref:uracil-DNA glycosylase family protein n=1 Tax=Clostridium sp. JS66 TaxID=3064705 RepID=UPI00298DDC95|nr:uracil-DNA glycosylase family protein [Clostridium sp. JS66]WPC40869.1 uracil-DNA glycosylase family protein [Clostridium sp. JS66]